MSGQELSAWQAYEQETGPLGAERDDILAAMTAYYVVTSMQGKKSKARLDKMLPKWAPKRPEGWESMKTKLMALTRAGGGDVITRD